ncbi:MAG: hypothetical protein DBO98_01210 [Candidatus Liberibacter europaeus]|nr:hypothetical protein [Candidatus Liberibacter europaeus]
MLEQLLSIVTNDYITSHIKNERSISTSLEEQDNKNNTTNDLHTYSKNLKKASDEDYAAKRKIDELLDKARFGNTAVEQENAHEQLQQAILDAKKAKKDIAAAKKIFREKLMERLTLSDYEKE